MSWICACMYELFACVRASAAPCIKRAATAFCMVALLSMQTAGTASAQERELVPLRILESLHMDGVLDEGIWQNALAASGFTQQRPDEGQPSSERTEVRVLYDEQTLYIGVWAYDSDPSQIIATQMARDGDLADDDYFQIILDTYMDRQNGILFATNPDGARYDAQVRNEGRSEGRFNTNVLTDWNGVWDVYTSRNEAGWYAEMAIPWSTLRFETGDDVDFGINLERQIRRRNEQAFWAPVIRPFNISQVSVAGTLAGMNLTRHDHRYLQVTPYSLGGATWTFQPGTTERDDDFDGGVDVKYGLTNNLSLDLTYNTDFSQVEVDDAQVNLTQFNLFFPEKRAFFLENAGLFRFGVARETELFYSRNVGLVRDASGTLRQVPITGGGRLTGKADRTNLGLLLMRTGDERFGDNKIEDNIYAVARVSQDVGEKSNVGFILTNQRVGGGDYNRAAGADFNLAIGPKLAVSGFLAGTTFEQGESSESGFAGRLWSRWNGPLWQFEGLYMGVSEFFDPGMGFFSRRSLARNFGGFHEVSARAFFTPEPTNSIVRRYFPHIVLSATFGDDGTQLTRREHYHWELFFTGGEQAGITLDRAYRRISADTRPILGVKLPVGNYTDASTRMHYTTNLSKPLFADFQLILGQYINGDRRSLNLEGGVRTGSKFAIGPRYELNDVTLTDTANMKREVTTHLFGVRTSYSFSPDVSLNALVQWDTNQDRFVSNFRFNYIISPGSNLYIVYNENRDNGDMTDALLGDPLDRTLIVKLAYLFDI